MRKPYDFLRYIPGEAVACKIVGTVDPDGTFHKVSEAKRGSLRRYISKVK